MSFVPCVWDDYPGNGRMILAKTLGVLQLWLATPKLLCSHWMKMRIKDISMWMMYNRNWWDSHFWKQISGGHQSFLWGRWYLWFTSGVTTTAASMAAELFSSTYLQTKNLWGSRLRFLSISDVLLCSCFCSVDLHIYSSVLTDYLSFFFSIYLLFKKSTNIGITMHNTWLIHVS